MINQIVQTQITSNNNRILAVIFLTAIFVLLLIGLLIILPSAEIILQVKSEPFIDEFQIKVDQSVKKPLYNLNVIPGSIYSLYNVQQKEDVNNYLVIDYIADKQESKILILRQDLDNFLNQKLINLAPVPKVIIGEDIQLIDYKIKSFDLKNGQVVIILSIKAKVIPNYNLQFLKEFLSDKSKTMAMNYLQSLPNIQNVKINSWPVSLDRLPRLSKRIRIRLDII